MADTIGMIVGEVGNLSTFVLERDDMDPISNQVRRELDTYDPTDEVIICTDMIGSSVNNDMVGLLPDYPQVTLNSGMNLPLVITFVMDEGPANEEELADIVNYAILIADKYDLDIKQIVLEKLRKNAEKYPVEKAYGSAKKYNEL